VCRALARAVLAKRGDYIGAYVAGCGVDPVRYNRSLGGNARRLAALARSSRASCNDFRPPLTSSASLRMSYYKHHVFFCCNQRNPPEVCCANHGSVELQAYAKDRIKKLGLNGAGKVRMNKAGCLDRCELGPVIVVYPEGVWYTYVDRDDIDEIIDRHIIGGEIVERLRI